MVRLDFLGIPGAGKTTLYQALLKERRHQGGWLTPQEAKIKIAKKYLYRCRRSIRELARLLILATGSAVLQKKISENIYHSLAQKAIQERLEEWMPFMELGVECLGDSSKSAYYRLRSAQWLLIQLEEIALVEGDGGREAVVFDDSLAQRATGIIPWDYDRGVLLGRRYFELLPPPGAVIYLHGEPQQVVERIIGRQKQKIIVQHRGLSGAELLERTKTTAAIVEEGVKVLSGRNIPVLKLDAMQPVDELAKSTGQFIKQIVGEIE